MTPEPAIARSALIVGLGNVGSRVLGLVREQVIAGLFGASASTDAFRVAFRVPLTIYDLLVGGMISAALVPVFSGYLAAGRVQELASLVGALGTLLLLLLGAIVALLALVAGPLMDAIAAGYDEPVRTAAAGLLRVLLPGLMFMGLSGLATAALYAQRRFGPPAMAVTGFNSGIIVLGLLLHSRFGVLSLAAGVVAGSAVQFLVQLVALRRAGFSWSLHLAHPGLSEVLRLYLPVALGLVVSTAGVLIDTNLASRTGEGGLAAMGFATTLVQLPLGLVAAGVSSAVLPILAAQAPPSSIPFPGYKAALVMGLRLVLLTIVPAAVGLVLLRVPIVRLLFQRGAFDTEATSRTATAFLAYAPGLPAAALDQILIQGYYARRRTLTPVLVGIISVGAYLVTALTLLEPMGMPGLALANSVQWCTHLAIMAALTHRAVGGLGGLGLGGTATRCLVGSGAMAVLLVGAQVLGLADTVPLALYLPVLIALAAALYVLVLARTSPADLRLLAGALRRRGVEK